VKPPPAPRDLRTSGTVLWRKLVREFEYNSAEIELLHQLCVTVDEIAAMRSDLAEMGMVTMGSKNQPVVNPLLSALVSHRKLCDQLTTALGLPVEGEAVGRKRSASAKRAADARWRKPSKLGGRVAQIRRSQDRGA
jgi:P27 family predicted phage terminase small subunit